MRTSQVIFFFFVSLIGLTLTALAQGYSLSIAPASGPPGTTVSLAPNPTYSDERCFANGAPIGHSYVVPADASGTITFYCEAGSGEFYSRTNDAVFTVIPLDSDGDGIPDDQDACPDQPYQGNNGCPPSPTEPPAPTNPPIATVVPQPEEPAPPPGPTVSPDRDGDGIPDSQDACPDQFFQNGNGCPSEEPAEPQPAPVQPQEPSPNAQPEPVQPQIILPEIPDDDICQTATNGAFRANVRVNFSEDAQIITQLDPEQVVPVQAQATLIDERYPAAEPEVWLKIDAGWVAGQIMRTGGDCDDLPEIMLIDDEPRERPERCADEPFVVVFDDFNPETRRQLWGLVLWRLDYVDTEVSGNAYIGTPCDEYIFATDSTDIIDGGGGNDWIFGFGGADILVGGDGHDFIWAGNGNDIIAGSSGDDRIYGDYYLYETIRTPEGLNKLRGFDVIFGNSGDDHLMGGGSNDLIMGHDGDDVLVGDRGNDRLYGGRGDDYIVTGYGIDYAVGGSGDDNIFVLGGLGRAFGNDGNDTLRDLHTPIDKTLLLGGPGDDVLTGLNLHGGDGDDRLILENVDNGVERVGWAFGNAGDDSIQVRHWDRRGFFLYINGGTGNDWITGSQSIEVVFGGSGDDYILGYDGNDYLDGGDGDDEIYGSWQPLLTSHSYPRVPDDNNIIGGAGADIIDGGPRDNDACITDDRDTVSGCDTDSVTFAYMDRIKRWWWY